MLWRADVRHPVSVEAAGELDVRVACFDIARVAAIAAVIALHVTATAYTRAPSVLWPWVLNRALIDYAAPMLLVIAGALSWSPKRLRQGDYGRYMAARAFRVLLPYVTWAVFYLWYKSLLGAAHRDVFGYAELVFTGLAWYHLWFVPAVMAVYVVAPAGAALARRHPVLVIAAAYAVSFVIILVVDVPEPLLISPEVQRSILTTARYFPYAAWGALYAWSPRLRVGLRRLWPVAIGVGVAAGYVMTVPFGSAVMTAWVRTLPIGLVEVGLLGAFTALASAWPRLSEGAAALAPLVFVLYLSHAAPLRLIDDVVAARAPQLFGQAWFVGVLFAVVVATGSLTALAWVRAERMSAARRTLVT
jgi:surface polysaccharide O-acyltransferase-like enzyme